MAVGTRWNFAPVQDIARDNRWGRYYEPWSEDKLLAGAMGAANITGMQNERGDQLDVAATVKHFAAYGSSINGHDRVQSEIPIRLLQDTFLPSYKAAIDAGAATVMTQDSLDQPHPGVRVEVPADRRSCATGWASRACSISDYQNIPQLVGQLQDGRRPGRGRDPGDQRRRRRLDDPAQLPGVHGGRADRRPARVDLRGRINQAVRRILTLKFRLGLFEDPYVESSRPTRR